MHDTSDPYMPITQAYRLPAPVGAAPWPAGASQGGQVAGAIADPPARMKPGQADHKVYAEFALFEHVYPTRLLHQLALAREGVRLIAYLSQLLAEMAPD